MITTTSPEPWWAERVFSLVSLLIGAVIGFGAAQLKEWLDGRRRKKAFLAAIKVELTTMGQQLERARAALTAAEVRFAAQGTPPQFAVMLSTTVFSSQLPQLQSLSDKVVLKVVNFYSTLPVLDNLARLVNEQGTEYLKLTDPAQLDQAGIRIRSALRVTLDEIEKYQGMLADVQAALP